MTKIRLWFSRVIILLLTLDIAVLTIILISLSRDYPYIVLLLSLMGLIVFSVLFFKELVKFSKCPSNAHSEKSKDYFSCHIYVQRLENGIRKISSIFAGLTCLSDKVVNRNGTNKDTSQNSDGKYVFHRTSLPKDE